MAAPFLLSKALDPVFAVFIGVCAAAIRINREEKEKGRTTRETLDSVKRRFEMVSGKRTGQRGES